MEPMTGNPFGVMTLIVAPAILTNASSILALGTSNRFALAAKRAKSLAAEVARRTNTGEATQLRLEHLTSTEQRVRLLVRALTAFYLSAGLFAATGLLSLIGALSFEAHQDFLRSAAFGVVLCSGVTGVSTVVAGCGLLVWESHITLRVLAAETTFRDKHPRQWGVKGRGSDHLEGKGAERAPTAS